MEEPRLKRSISLSALIFYGTGTMIGGGFYALIGKVVLESGMNTPFALLLTGGLALLSAFSFAELGARFPSSAGPARYVEKGFGRPALATLVGWLVILTGVVSAATLAVATIGFLQDAFTFPAWIGIIVLVALMGLVAGRGIGESVAVVTVITVLEIGGLLYVFAFNAEAFADLPARAHELLPARSVGVGGWTGVFAGAFLAFYAFIGFEDMVTMAEEVKNPSRNLPLAILVCIGLTTFLYVIVATAAVLALPPDRLIASKTPVAELAGDGRWARGGVWLISLLTGLNGALVQIIMASRVAYGMARRGQAPEFLGRINATTRTPLIGTVLVVVIILGLALLFPLATLAKTTSAIMLAIFAMVNLALYRLKKIDPDPGGPGPRFPRWLPLLGGFSSALVLLFQLRRLII